MQAVTASSPWTRLRRGPTMDEATIKRRRWWTLGMLNLSPFAIHVVSASMLIAARGVIVSAVR